MGTVKDEAISYMSEKLRKAQCNLKMKMQQHDNATIPNIERKIRIYTLAVKALRAYREDEP